MLPSLHFRVMDFVCVQKKSSIKQDAVSYTLTSWLAVLFSKHEEASCKASN